MGSEVVRHTPPDDSVSLIGTLNILLRHARLILGTALVFFVIGYAFVALQKPMYKAESKFLLHSSASPSAASGFAAAVGLGSAGGGSGESMDFYAALLKSRALLSRAGESTYRVGRAPGDTVTAPLADFYEDIPRASPALRAAVAGGKVGSKLDVETDGRTGLVTLQTTAPYPDLAEAINRRLLELVNDFNLRRRQTQAAAERRFVEDRMHQAQQQLQAAEGDQEAFLEQNRSTGSPQLSVLAQRLQRRVDLRQGIYVSLAQAYEQARIQEVRDTPLITIIEPPDGTAGSTMGNPMKTGILAALVGFFLATMVAFLSHYVTRVAPSDVSAYQEFRRIMQSSPLGRLSRVRRTA